MSITSKKTNAKKILVADDDGTIQEFFSQILPLWGYDVLLAKDGNECYLKAIANRPDLIILDAYMPACSGMEAARLLQKDARTQAIPIIGVSGRDQPDEHVINDAFINSGAGNFIKKRISLTKPFNLGELKRTVEETLAPGAPLTDAPQDKNNALLEKNLVFQEEIQEEPKTNLIIGDFTLDLGSLVARSNFFVKTKCPDFESNPAPTGDSRLTMQAAEAHAEEGAMVFA